MYKLDILAFAAHPDDIELSCSGTLVTHLKKGYKVGIIDLTRGELGTRGSVELRFEEAAKASAIMGITVRENLGFRDGFFTRDEQHLLKVIQVIRKYQPDIVLANAESDRHIDHGRAAELVHDACFLSGLRKIETTYEGQLQQAWRPRQVYHYIQDRLTKPNIIVDISDSFEEKIQSIEAYSSQFYDPNSTEPVTPIATKEFLEAVKGRCAEFGKEIGVQYGEGFTVRRNIGSKNLLEQL